MGFSSTFGAFTTARLGIYASQIGLNVTGNNIANINTVGYTRQVVDQISLKVGAHDRYQAKYSVNVGNGALVTGLSQIRDPYLDIRYRNEASSVGAMDSKLAGLQDLQAILDEVAKGDDGNGVIEAQLSDLIKTLENLSIQTGQEEYDAQVRASASALVSLFHTYATKLEGVHEDTVDNLNQDIETVNKRLSNIRDLNASIRKSEIHGDTALELRDERNRLIDELSQYMKIDVIYTTEDLGDGFTVEKLQIKLGNANPDADVTTDSSFLVDGVYATQISLPTVPQPNPDYDENDPASLPYLTEDGTPTDDATLAAQITNPNYTLMLSGLKDSNDRVMENIVDRATAPITEQEYNDAVNALGGETSWVFADDGKGNRTTIEYTKRVTLNNDGTTTTTYFQTTTVSTYSTEVTLDDNDLYGSLQATRELLTEEGEFASQDDIALDENAAIKRGIPYYQKSLDMLANKFATMFNSYNKGYQVDESGNYLDADGNTIELLGEALNKNGLTAAQEAELANQGITLEEYLLNNNAVALGGNLFSVRGDSDDGEGITASNISISASWAKGDVHIVNSFVSPKQLDTGSTANDNILHMISLMDKDLVYNPQELFDDADSTHLFEGSFQEMLTNINSVLGNDIYSTNILLNNYYSAAVELDTSRDSVSGVDLNDEAANLMQYQKSYSAACRLMTVLDQALDKLINGTGTVGL